MTDLVIERLDADAGTIGALRNVREEIELNPEYHRDGDIWDLARRRLLIDSFLNGYDIPKLYFRSYVPRILINNKPCRYSVIDGKQRLQTDLGLH